MNDEYEYLNSYILQDKEFVKNYRIAMYTIFAGLTAFGFSTHEPLIFLLPILTILPIFKICMGRSDSYIKTESYILVFLETENKAKWETRKNQLSKNRLIETNSTIAPYCSLISCSFMLFLFEKTDYLTKIENLNDNITIITCLFYVISMSLIYKNRINYRKLKDKYICKWENIKWSENAPLISVLMPVYNDESNVAYAIKSILDQSYTNFELIIVNDGSTDNTRMVIESFDDPRINIYNRPHRGVAESLNEGLKYARGRYIARMDSDDISFKNRLSLQLSYLQSHPNVKILGTEYFIYENQHLTYFKLPTKSEDVNVSLAFGCCIRHSTAMFERRAIEKGYSSYYNLMEDYYLWVSNIGICKMENLRVPLLIHQKRSNSVTGQYCNDKISVLNQFKTIQELALKKLTILLPEQIDSFSSLLRRLYTSEFCARDAYIEYREIIRQIPIKQRIYPHLYFMRCWNELVKNGYRHRGLILFKIRFQCFIIVYTSYLAYKKISNWNILKKYCKQYNLFLH